jgi:hypothetical protein
MDADGDYAGCHLLQKNIFFQYTSMVAQWIQIAQFGNWYNNIAKTEFEYYYTRF